MPIFCSSHSIYGMARNWLRMLGIRASVRSLFIARFVFEGCTLLAVLYWFWSSSFKQTKWNRSRRRWPFFVKISPMQKVVLTKPRRNWKTRMKELPAWVVFNCSRLVLCCFLTAYCRLLLCNRVPQDCWIARSSIYAVKGTTFKRNELVFWRFYHMQIDTNENMAEIPSVVVNL